MKKMNITHAITLVFIWFSNETRLSWSCNNSARIRFYCVRHELHSNMRAPRILDIQHTNSESMN